MKIDKESIGRRWIPYTIASCAAVVLYLVLSRMGDLRHGLMSVFRFIQPVFWGILLAYIIDALVVLIEKAFFRRAKKRRLARCVSILLAIILILILLGLFAVALIPKLISSITGLINNIGIYAASLVRFLENAHVEIAGHTVDFSELAKYGDSLLDNLTVLLQDNIGRIINTSFTIGKGFVNGVIIFILAVYFLLDKERVARITGTLLRWKLTPERYARTRRFLNHFHHILIRFIACDILDALAVGVVNYIFMTICGMPYSILISVVVAVANLVPTFGPIAGGAAGTFILLLVNPRYVLRFLVFTLILQLLDGYVLKPKLFGDSLGVSPLWVLIVIVIGGRMFGATGVLLSIPLAAISDVLLRDFLHRRMEADARKRRPAPASGGLSADVLPAEEQVPENTDIHEERETQEKGTLPEEEAETAEAEETLPLPELRP